MPLVYRKNLGKPSIPNPSNQHHHDLPPTLCSMCSHSLFRLFALPTESSAVGRSRYVKRWLQNRSNRLAMVAWPQSQWRGGSQPNTADPMGRRSQHRLEVAVGRTRTRFANFGRFTHLYPDRGRNHGRSDRAVLGSFHGQTTLEYDRACKWRDAKKQQIDCRIQFAGLRWPTSDRQLSKQRCHDDDGVESRG